MFCFMCYIFCVLYTNTFFSTRHTKKQSCLLIAIYEIRVEYDDIKGSVGTGVPTEPLKGAAWGLESRRRPVIRAAWGLQSRHDPV